MAEDAEHDEGILKLPMHAEVFDTSVDNEQLTTSDHQLLLSHRWATDERG
jgi:hypothetical protein